MREWPMICSISVTRQLGCLPDLPSLPVCGVEHALPRIRSLTQTRRGSDLSTGHLIASYPTRVT